jgi:hypothetical protein
MEPSSGREGGGPPSVPLLVAAQLGSLLLAGAVVGALLPRATALMGLAGGFLAFVTVTAGGLVRRWWQGTAPRHPHWSLHGPEVVTREVVRTGVGLLAVLVVIGPVTLGAGLLPTWFLAAVGAGVAAALPVGVAAELQALDAAAEEADPRRLWRLAVGTVAVGALALSLLLALAGLVRWPRAFAWVASALAALALTAWIRACRTAQGSN